MTYAETLSPAHHTTGPAGTAERVEADCVDSMRLQALDSKIDFRHGFLRRHRNRRLRSLRQVIELFELGSLKRHMVRSRCLRCVVGR
jgi:hypothetical protein